MDDPPRVGPRQRLTRGRSEPQRSPSNPFFLVAHCSLASEDTLILAEFHVLGEGILNENRFSLKNEYPEKQGGRSKALQNSKTALQRALKETLTG